MDGVVWWLTNNPQPRSIGMTLATPTPGRNFPEMPDSIIRTLHFLLEKHRSVGWRKVNGTTWTGMKWGSGM